MPKLVYGVWDNIVYDNRQSSGANLPELDLSVFDQFNEQNPASALLTHRGFLVFDSRVPLLWLLWQHFNSVCGASCGKCSPCRTGAPIIRNAIAKACEGGPIDWNNLKDICSQMLETSLCGIGKTGPKPLLDAMEHFQGELRPQEYANTSRVYSAITSPCMEACPGIVNIPRYIDYIKDGHNDLSANTVLYHYPLVGSCGRVCVRTCESACVRGKVDSPISIRNLKRFAADKAIASNVLKAPKANITKEDKIAVVGAGPVGVSCAWYLLERGYPVDIFEYRPKAGGMIRYGIPIYRLPKNTLQKEIDLVASLGGNFIFGQKMGRDFNVDDLFKRGYKAIFICAGCQQGAWLGMPDEDTSLEGYENGIDFLERVYNSVEDNKPITLEGDVIVVGGGNVAMDCCRAAVRTATGKVHIVYRRTEADAPADHEEIEAAKAEGVEFHFLCGQDRLVVENGKIVGLKVVDMERTEPDASGRRGVKPIPNSEKVIPCSHVIAAIGQQVDPSILQESDGVARDRKNCIIINTAHETSRKGVFAGGDCTSGPRASGPTTMIMGMGHAYFAARSIDKFLSKEQVPFDSRWRMTEWIKNAKLMNTNAPAPDKEKKNRVSVHEMDPAIRKKNFEEVEYTMSQEEAWAESSRCMRCYRVFSVMTKNPIPGNK